ncbi:hypothetical protein DL769_001305 [Monosporascus sp. CRB-8-3]|nr:hypothetical protein DL769_001305 [Monosporascus sp. CRB-8-3]
MMLRGPPDLDDDLDPWPAMENRASILAYRMIGEFDDFFLQPEWKEAIAQARLSVCIAEAQETSDALEKAVNLGLITEVADPDCPGGIAYDFQMIDFGALLAGVLALKMLLLHMLCDIMQLMGSPEEFRYKERARVSHQVCMFAPYLRRQGPIASLLYMSPFFLAFKANPEQLERDYIIDFIIWVDSYRQRLPPSRSGVEELVPKTVNGMTGRVHFDEIPWPKLSR